MLVYVVSSVGDDGGGLMNVESWGGVADVEEGGDVVDVGFAIELGELMAKVEVIWA
jgi:hypothetical protein